MKTAKCRSCQADIVWAKCLSTGRLMPVNAAHSENGNIVLSEDGDSCEVLGKESAATRRESGGKLHLNHFATCPNSKSHREEKPS